jgi:cyanophycinase-like exopeptidase
MSKSAARILMILGSGETSPIMVTPHQKVFARLDSDANAVLLDSPYGFQENADELTDRIQQYFRESVGRTVDEISFRSAPPPDLAEHAAQLQQMRQAKWIFAGPGSPSYALRTWQDSAVPEVLHERLRDGGVVVFASAAALTLGRHTVPVYEIYKVGDVPHWLPGLDVLGRATGLTAAVIPHWNNAEGGTHDTRFCYLGERRLRRLEDELPDDSFVLGVDEHTGLVIDLDSGAAEVVGRGVVTVRRNGVEWSVAAGDTTSIDEIAKRSGADRTRNDPSAVVPAMSGDLIAAAELAIADRDVAVALAAVMELQRGSRTVEQAQEVRRLLSLAAAAAGAPIDATEVIAPYVDLLLRLRESARADKRWEDSDAIRDGLAAAGVNVQDTATGSTWELTK